jgi:uncharacterized protein (DUF302 family)
MIALQQTQRDRGELMTDYTLGATIDLPYEHAVARVRALLTDAGFGVLTEIDLAATFRAKLGIELPPGVIIGACRPPLAHRALEADPRIATMLPVMSSSPTAPTHGPGSRSSTQPS